MAISRQPAQDAQHANQEWSNFSQSIDDVIIQTISNSKKFVFESIFIVVISPHYDFVLKRQLLTLINVSINRCI